MGGDVAPAVPFDPRARASYRAWVQIPIRFSDQDLLGHVNNNAIGVYFEHARCVHLLPPVPTAGLTYDDRDALADQVRARMAECLRQHYGVDTPDLRPSLTTA